jgi:hypothetical protein
MKLFISSILLLLLAPCNSEQKVSSTTPSQDYSTINIVYAETPCYGNCPIYVMTLDGKTMVATFKGEANTEKIGTYTKSISPEEFSQFMSAFEKANFDKLDNEYMGTVPDFPIRETTLTKDGKSKKIRNRSDGPKELDVLEKVFKDYAVSDGWKKQGAN